MEESNRPKFIGRDFSFGSGCAFNVGIPILLTGTMMEKPRSIVHRSLAIRPFVLASIKQSTDASLSRSNFKSSFLPSSCQKNRVSANLYPEEIQNSNDYTRVVFRSPEHQAVHRYRDCVLEFDGLKDHTNLLKREEKRHFPTPHQLKESEKILEQCKLCKSSLLGKDIFMYRDSRFCSLKCRFDEFLLNQDEHVTMEGIVSDPCSPRAPRGQLRLPFSERSFENMRRLFGMV